MARIALGPDGRGYDVDALLRKISRLERHVERFQRQIRDLTEGPPPPRVPGVVMSARRTARQIAICPACDRVVVINQDGRLRAHRADPAATAHCAESGRDGTALAYDAKRAAIAWAELALADIHVRRAYPADVLEALLRVARGDGP